MAGGLIQLVAVNVEDLYLIAKPTITFFKTVFRRHTNFSKVELDLRFSNNIGFGKEGCCIIQHYGDLIHKLYFRIVLPDINVFYKSLTVKEVKNILRDYNIIWNTDKNDGAIFEQECFNEVSILIDEKIIELENYLNNVNIFIDKLTDENSDLNINNWLNNNSNIENQSDKYINDVLIEFFKNSDLNVQFRIIDACIKDKLNNPTKLFNLIQTQQLLQKLFIEYAVSEDFNDSTFNDKNIEFLFNVDSANYIIKTGNDIVSTSSSIFRSGINSAYNGVQFTHLDAYKIFDYIIINNPAQIMNASDIQTYRTLLLNNIRFGLIKNLRQHKNIYSSFTENSKFIFYRRFPIISVGNNTFNLTTLFSTFSLVNNPPMLLNDNYTSIFDIANEMNEPNNITHPFSICVKNIVTNFHKANVNLFNTIKIKDYFDDINLWNDTDVKTSNYTPSSISSVFPFRVFFINYIWLLMNNDICESIKLYIDAKNNFNMSQNIIDQFKQMLIDAQIFIQNNIYSKITNNDNYLTLTQLNSSVKNMTGENGDIVMGVIFRPGINHTIVNFDIYNNITIPEFIVSVFVNLIQNSNIPVDAKNIFTQIVNLFITPIETLPIYSNYVAQNNNISSNFALQINNIGQNGIIFHDAQSSVFNHLFNNFVVNYNDNYNLNILNDDFFEIKIGAESLENLKSISQNFFQFDVLENDYDYFRNISTNSTLISSICNIFNTKINELYLQYDQYDANRGILNTKNILVQRSIYFYELFNINLNNFINIIENNFSTYFHTFHNTIDDIALITRNNLLGQNLKNAINIINDMQNSAIMFFNGTGITSANNIYDENDEKNKFDLWEELNNTFKKLEQINLFNKIFECFLKPFGSDISGATKLFERQQKINSCHNSFATDIDVLKFMMDIVIQLSILKDIPSLKKISVTETYECILNYFIQELQTTQQSLNEINGVNNNLPLKELLEKSLNFGNVARFAWIKKLGHFIIDKIWIKIDDQIIDTQNGEYLDIWHSLTKIVNREHLYDRLIGNVHELTNFDDSLKKKYELLIPLEFWFCKNISSSLPLISLIHSEVKVFAKLKKFEEVSFHDSLVEFKPIPKIECNMIGEFIYVENDERIRLTGNKLSYLIDTIQYENDTAISINEIDENNIFEKKYVFYNLCKELFWIVQDVQFINGSLPFGERMWNHYSNVLNDDQYIVAKSYIKFNNRFREYPKDSMYYNYVQPYEKHNSDPNFGVFVYSFSLNPEHLQPSGSANMGRIDCVNIGVEFNEQIRNEIADGKKLVMKVYNVSYNTLMIMSGLGGLQFFGTSSL